MPTGPACRPLARKPLSTRFGRKLREVADMTGPGNYETNTDDMRAVHGALRQALASVPALVSGAESDQGKVDIVASFYENVFEFLHVHHVGEDELIYPVLKKRCPSNAELIERINAQHELMNAPMARGEQALVRWRAEPSEETGAELVASL